MTSCASDRTGAARQRNSTSARLGAEVEARPRPARLAVERLVLRPASESGAPASSTTSPSRQPAGTTRTSGTSPTQPTTGAGGIARPSVSL